MTHAIRVVVKPATRNSLAPNAAEAPSVKVHARVITPSRIFQAIVLWMLWISATAQAQLAWTAFNDLYIGPGTSTNTTAWNPLGTTGGAPGSSGPLTNATTGARLPVTLAINSTGSVGQGSASGAPFADTPAYNIFSGYIDWTSGSAVTPNVPAAPQLPPGVAVEYVFSGLDPLKRYSFAGTSIRGGSGGDYPLRWTLIEVVGADASTPAHSTGAGAYTNGLPATQVAINSGQNNTTGDVAQWDSIDPGADGVFTIRCTQYTGAIPGGTAGAAYAYALMAIRFQEFNVIPTPVAITVQPTNQSVIELRPVNFRAVAIGNPPPAFQWYKNDAPIAGATNSNYSIDSASMADNNAQFYVVAANVVTNVSYVVTSSIVTLSVQHDTLLPAIANVFPPRNTLVHRLTWIEVDFNKAVTGVDASDLLINGLPATNVIVEAPDAYRFLFPQPADGLVTFTWAPGHGIQDWASPPNLFAGGSFTYTLDSNVNYGLVRINEFMASNKRGIRDEDGEYSDWIELFNADVAPVSLEGWYLTDTATNLIKWKFPPVNIASNGFLLVWASSKDRTNPAALHTNFKLDKDSGYLALVAPDGLTIVSSSFCPYPTQYVDVSFGCDRIEPTLVGFFTNATPRAPNANLGAGFGPEVQFSVESGTFTAPFNLVLTSSDTNAVIRYTLGTNAPTTSSLVYTNPIAISNSVQVRARAYVPGLFPGDIQSKQYIRLDTSATTIPGSSFNVAGFNSPLPIIVFHNNGLGAVPYADPAQFTMMQVFEPKNGRSALTNAPDLSVQADFHRRGQATLNLPKMNLRLTTRDEYGDTKNVPLVGLPSDDDWILYGINGYDKVLMHNPLAHELYRQMGHYSVRTRYVEVFIKQDSGSPGPLTPADYYGLYVLEEKIKVSNDRVDIGQLRPENTNAPSITGGYIFSVDKTKTGDAPSFNAGGHSFQYVDPDYYDITPAQSQYLQGYLNSFWSVLSGASWTNPVTGYAQYIDVPVFIDFHLQNTFVFNADMLRISTYHSKPRNGKLSFASLWDFDRAFAMYAQDGDSRGFNPWRWRSGSGDGGTDPFNNASIFGNPWYSKLFTDPDFWQKYIDRYQELRKSVYSYSNVTAVIDRFGSEVNEATAREYANAAAKWSGTSSDTRPNSGTITADGWTYSFTTPGSWASQLQFIRSWFTNRLTFMDTNFMAQPVLSSPGGSVPEGFMVTISVPTNPPGTTVYYTLDGTDPRLPSSGGRVSPSALVYTSPIVINNNCRLVARAFNTNHFNLTGPSNPPLSSPWSGPCSASFFVHIPLLRITEIMYHPQPPALGNTNSAENFEYVEVKNIGTDALNLAGFRLSGGIDFVFTNFVLAGGQSAVVVANTASFQSRYGTSVPIAGQFPNQLNNAGDRLVLEGPFGEPIHDFVYDPKWYPITDGFGFSLVIQDANGPLSTWGQKESWRVSGYANGSPGSTDEEPPYISPVKINEVLTHVYLPGCDIVELFNSDTAPADVSGWFLTDDFRNPNKYRIPAPTIIPAGQFVLLYATNSFDSAYARIPFGFSSAGDELYLFSGDANTNLTGYFHGYSFGAAETDVTFGRYVTSTGEDHFVAQGTNSFGTTNIGPKVGPLVIKQIMYHPTNHLSTNDNILDEYVEVYNISATPVPLYHPAYPTNTWHLRGGVDLDFPTNVVLNPGTSLVLVNFDPVTNLTQLVAFTNKYPLLADLQMFGPYSGKLGNGPDGDRVALRKPSDPELTGVVPNILVDEVVYKGVAPWPAVADGFGPALLRKDVQAYGNDPINWAAVNPLSIQMQPQSITNYLGSNAVFSVLASGSGTLTYQWRFEGVDIPNATNSTYAITNLAVTHQGNYMVVISDGYNSVSSVPAYYLALRAPVILRQPDHLTVAVGSRASFSILSYGLPWPNQIFWRQEGVLITNIASYQTNCTLTLENVPVSLAGEVTAVVSNSVSGRWALSSRRIFTVVTPPRDQSVPAGSNAVLTVSSAAGRWSSRTRYQWQFNGLNIANATNAVLTVTNVQADKQGTYTVSVINASNLVASFSAQVALGAADADGDGIPDWWETQYGLNPANSNDALADADGDGMSNYAEYVAGTDPTDDSSYLRLNISGFIAGSPVLDFQAVSNRSYTILRNDSLGTNNWSSLTNFAPTPTNRTVIWPDPSPGTGNHFYRLVIPPSAP